MKYAMYKKDICGEQCTGDCDTCDKVFIETAYNTGRRWNSVDVMMPEPFEDVIVWIEYGDWKSHDFAFAIWTGQEWELNHSSIDRFKVEAWIKSPYPYWGKRNERMR